MHLPGPAATFTEPEWRAFLRRVMMHLSVTVENIAQGLVKMLTVELIRHHPRKPS
jgi:hypothetical protein